MQDRVDEWIRVHVPLGEDHLESRCLFHDSPSTCSRWPNTKASEHAVSEQREDEVQEGAHTSVEAAHMQQEATLQHDAAYLQQESVHAAKQQGSMTPRKLTIGGEIHTQAFMGSKEGSEARLGLEAGNQSEGGQHESRWEKDQRQVQDKLASFRSAR